MLRVETGNAGRAEPHYSHPPPPIRLQLPHPLAPLWGSQAVAVAQLLTVTIISYVCLQRHRSCLQQKMVAIEEVLKHHRPCPT